MIRLVKREDFSVVLLCQNVYVLGAGKIIEHGTMDKFLSSPQTDWMKQFSALSHRESRGEWKWEKL